MTYSIPKNTVSFCLSEIKKHNGITDVFFDMSHYLDYSNRILHKSPYDEASVKVKIFRSSNSFNDTIKEMINHLSTVDTFLLLTILKCEADSSLTCIYHTHTNIAKDFYS